MNISQEDVILIRNLYLSKQYGARRAMTELPDKTWKPGSIDSWLKRQPGSGRPCSARSSRGPCAQSGGKAKKASVNPLDFA